MAFRVVKRCWNGALLLPLRWAEDLAEDDGIAGGSGGGEKFADWTALVGPPGPGDPGLAFLDAFQGRLFGRAEGRLGFRGGQGWSSSAARKGRRRRGGLFFRPGTYRWPEEIEDAQLLRGLLLERRRGRGAPLPLKDFLAGVVVEIGQGLVLVPLLLPLQVLPDEFQGRDDHEDQENNGLGIIEECFHLIEELELRAGPGCGDFLDLGAASSRPIVIGNRLAHLGVGLDVLVTNVIHDAEVSRAEGLGDGEGDLGLGLDDLGTHLLGAG